MWGANICVALLRGVRMHEWHWPCSSRTLSQEREDGHSATSVSGPTLVKSWVFKSPARSQTLRLLQIQGLCESVSLVLTLKSYESCEMKIICKHRTQEFLLWRERFFFLLELFNEDVTFVPRLLRENGECWLLMRQVQKQAYLWHWSLKTFHCKLSAFQHSILLCYK